MVPESQGFYLDVVLEGGVGLGDGDEDGEGADEGEGAPHRVGGLGQVDDLEALIQKLLVQNRVPGLLALCQHCTHCIAQAFRLLLQHRKYHSSSPVPIQSHMNVVLIASALYHKHLF